MMMMKGLTPQHQPGNTTTPLLTTRRSRYYLNTISTPVQSKNFRFSTELGSQGQERQDHLPDLPPQRLLKFARPTIFDLPYPLLGQVFVMSQNPNFLRTCKLMQELGQDPYIRCQYLEYKYLRNEDLDEDFHGNSYQQHQYRHQNTHGNVGHSRKRGVLAKQARHNKHFHHAHNQRGSFFAQMLRAVPPAENASLWTVLKHRRMLEGSTDTDIYNELKAKELALLRQQELTADFWICLPWTTRQILFTWIDECCEDFEWNVSTRYLAYMTLDRYASLAKNSLDYLNLQQTAGACLSLVSKSEELQIVPFNMLAEFAQTTPQVLCDTEVEIMETLRWNINMVPTAAMFLSYYVCQYIIRTPKSLHKSILYTTEHVIESDDRFVKALAHLDWAMAVPLAVAGVLPSLLAAWAFWKGLKELEQFQESTFKKCTEYSLAEVEDLHRFLSDNHAKIPYEPQME